MNTAPKTFVAITTGDWVLFAVHAANRTEALSTIQSVKTRSDTILSIRRLREDDLGVQGAAIVYR